MRARELQVKLSAEQIDKWEKIGMAKVKAEIDVCKLHRVAFAGELVCDVCRLSNLNAELHAALTSAIKSIQDGSQQANRPMTEQQHEACIQAQQALQLAG